LNFSLGLTGSIRISYDRRHASFVSEGSSEVDRLLGVILWKALDLAPMARYRRVSTAIRMNSTGEGEQIAFGAVLGAETTGKKLTSALSGQIGKGAMTRC
jgi:hypothetical protein